MGIKRCPSFSKRPGFPCGLRVLLLDCNEVQRRESEQLLQDCSYEVTSCCSTSEVLSKLSGSCSYDVLLVDRPSATGSGSSGEAGPLEQLLKSAEGVPCILMAHSPTPEDVMAGVKLGAVDFLSKPLAPQKLRNIWQHTVRKMMRNMNINCSDPTAAAAVNELAAGAACLGKARVSMEVILEESEEDLAATAAPAATAGGSAAATAAAAGKPPAPSSPSGATTPGSGSHGSVINYSNGPNMALAITSSFYEPSKSGARSLSRCGSSAMTSQTFNSTDGGSGSPGSPSMERPSKQLHGHHGPVRSCPSSRSLISSASCHSTWMLGLPASPSSDTLLTKTSSDVAMITAADIDAAATEAAGKAAPPRNCRRAVRHPSPLPTPTASKPPLASKPSSSSQQPAQPVPKPAAGTPASAAGKAAFPSGMPSVPLPTGLGPLPQGMVWGLPMCPLVRAPGIVPPSSGASTGAPCGMTAAAGMPAMPMGSWGMCPMPMYGAMPPTPFMGGGYGSMMPAMGMGMPYPAATASTSFGAGMPVSGIVDPYCQQQQMWSQHAMQQQQQQQMVAAGMRSSSIAAAGAPAPTGAAAAVALRDSLSAAELLGNSGVVPTPSAAVLDSAVDDDALNFVLGDITAEDDLPDVCGGLLDEDLSALAGDSIKMPAEVPTELQAQMEADLREQAAAAAAARCSFDSSIAQFQRVSFDCSTASTCTAARMSFDASQRSNSARVSFEVPAPCSNRVSFEVNCCNSGKPAAAAAGASAACHLGTAASAPPQLLGSVSDLLVMCSGGDSSPGSGLQGIDSCGADLADLQSWFAASGDSACPQDCADSALTGTSGIFLDPLDDMPIDLGLTKNDSFADLFNASLPGLVN